MIKSETQIQEITSFLNQEKNVSKRRRLWHIDHNIFNIPICPVCKITSLKWDNGLKSYRKTCSFKCRNNSIEWKEIMKQKMLQKYGVDNARKSSIIKEKIKKTKIDCYGNMNNLSQIQKTCMRKYGVDNIRKAQCVKDKIKQTNMKKYGNVSFVSSDQGKLKIKNSIMKKYGSDNIFKTKYFKDLLKEQSNKLYSLCGVKHHEQIHYGKDIFEKLSNKEYMFNLHITEKRNAQEIANIFDVNQTTVLNWLHRHNIKVNIYYTSTGQKEISQFLKNLIGETNIKENVRDLISPYELDIYIPEYKLAIEYCGLYWHSIGRLKNKNYHKNKLDLCNKQNIRLITIFEDEWIHNSEKVKNTLTYILNVNSNIPYYARKCNIISLTPNQKKNFFNKTHIQGNGKGSISYGLLFKGTLVAAITFEKINSNTYVLNRFSTINRVIGGFSKLLKWFMTHNQWDKIITFADLRWSTGNLYKKNGFTVDKLLKPDYAYADTNTTKRMHKFNFRHKHLPKIMGHKYNKNLSETKNMQKTLFVKIYDCGKLRFLIER